MMFALREKYKDRQSDQGRGDGQTCAAMNISFYINTNMFIGHFLYRGWLQIYIIQTRIFGICDVEIDGNSVIMCSWKY